MNRNSVVCSLRLWARQSGLGFPGGARDFPSPNLPRRVLCNSYWGFCRWDCSDRCLLLTTHLHLVPRLEMSGVVLLLFPSRPRRQLYLVLYVTGFRRTLSNMSLCSITSSRDAAYAVTMIWTDNVKQYFPKTRDQHH